MSQTKVMIVGNSGAQKTCLVYRLLGFVKRETDHTFTLGVEAHKYGKYVLWDMVGTPGSFPGKGLFYHSADIGIVVHGGEGYMTPEEWEMDLKKAMGENVQIHHLQGTFDEKFEQFKTILN